MNRIQNVAALKNNHFDILVIGGGASGAGVALDASLRGYKVALIEKSDFSSETSSRSTKLIHGGVRYLEQAFKKLDFSQVKQVKHGLAEREFLLKNALHLSKPLGIVTPVFNWFEAFYYTVGLKMYGLFAKKDHLPAARWLSKKETLLNSPNISPNVHSSVMYFDGQLDDARFNLALIQSANKKGVSVANYITLKGFKKDKNGKIYRALVYDSINDEEFEIQSKYFINCTGPFSDPIRKMANPDEFDRISPSKGVHIMLPSKFFEGDKAMLIPKTKDGRLIFVIPFQGKVMVGTTDTHYNEMDKEPMLLSDEIDFLLETLTPFLNEIPHKSEITSGFGGVRPLLAAKRKSKNETKTLLRDHEVEYDSDSGLISLLGGKWTTYRLMAQDTVDLVNKLENNNNKCTTHQFPLFGSKEHPDFSNYGELPDGTPEHLYHTYGSNMDKVISLAQETGLNFKKIHPNYPFLQAQVIYSVKYEMVETIRDFMSRRIRFEFLDWSACQESVELVGNLIGNEKGWSQNTITENIDSYIEYLKLARQKGINSKK